MLELELNQMMMIIGLVTSLALKSDLSLTIKRLLFFFSCAMIVIGSEMGPTWASGILIVFAYLSLKESRNLFNSFILLIILCIGDWSSPGLSEFLLVMLSGFLHLNIEDKFAKFTLPVFSITLMFYLINSSAIEPSASIIFGLLISVSLLFVNIFTKKFKPIDTISLISLLLFTSLLKFIVEQNISQLNLAMNSAWTNFNIIVILYVLLRTLVFCKNGQNNKEDFIKVFAISFYLPTLAAPAFIMPPGTSMIAAVAIIGAIFFLHQKNQTKLDLFINLSLGTVLIALQSWFVLGLDLQGAALLVAIAALASQVFYLIKSVEYFDVHSGKILYRERLPQIAFISITFGWICTLWYILYYVRKIQG